MKEKIRDVFVLAGTTILAILLSINLDMFAWIPGIDIDISQNASLTVYVTIIGSLINIVIDEILKFYNDKKLQISVVFHSDGERADEHHNVDKHLKDGNNTCAVHIFVQMNGNTKKLKDYVLKLEFPKWIDIQGVTGIAKKYINGRYLEIKLGELYNGERAKGEQFDFEITLIKNYNIGGKKSTILPTFYYKNKKRKGFVSNELIIHDAE